MAMAATGIIPLRAFLIFLGIASGVMFLNQVRTLVAHLWENDGEPMSVTEQYLDSVNVPPPATLPALWAPVGLRYHALHHLLPGVPYHTLGEAHRRITAALGREFALFRCRTIAGCRRWSRGWPSAAGEALAAKRYSSCLIRTNSPISRNSRNGAQAARNGG